jgi:hypothetical protein
MVKGCSYRLLQRYKKLILRRCCRITGNRLRGIPILELIYLFGILMWFFIAYKWGDWSKFNQNRSTVYIVLIGNLLYLVLTEGKKLWSMESPTFHIRDNILGVTVSFLTFPCSIVVFLTHYPEKGFLNQTLYNLCWIAFYTFNEWITCNLGVFSYADGWNLGWSALVNALMFPFLRLHQKKPNIALIVFVICTLVFIFLFKVPIFER